MPRAGAGGKKEILCAIGVDVDAVAGWLGSYGGENSPCDISRGLFAGEVGVPRLVKLFDRLGIPTSWFIPGHSIETFPTQCKMVVDAGHEIGMHGYSHENPIAMTPEQEEAVMDKCVELIERLSGRRPSGYVAPWWEFSTVTNQLLLKKGIKYDHSLMNDDFHPFYVRVGDSWTLIDYSKQPHEWMKPLVRGEETDLIDIPGSWYLDDLPPMMFIKSAPNSHGFIKPRDIEELWCDQFDWVYREYDYAVFAMTIHPDVSGRPQVLLMLERMYDYLSKHAGVKFCTFDEIADDFRRRHPRETAPAASGGRALAVVRMCALCGVLGGKGHWTDSGSAPEVFASRIEPQTRLRERQARVRILNAALKHQGVVAKDWSGNAYLLTSRTGRTAIVDTVADVWPAAERISGRVCDPLDEQYLSALAGAKL